MITILPRRGRIWLSTIVSHRLLFFPMIGIGIPVEYGFLPLILIKDPAHAGQLCKVVDVMAIHHHLHYWSEAIDKLHTFGPLLNFPMIMRKIPYEVLKPSCILCHRHVFQLEELHLLHVLHIF